MRGADISINNFEKDCSCLGGIGTFLFGIASLIAVFNTDNILEGIFRIQEQEKEIKRGVDELKRANSDLRGAVGDLRLMVKNGFAKQGIQTSALKEEHPTIEQINKSLDKFPNNPTCGIPVYLPTENRNKIIDTLQKATPQERELILQKALIYQPSSELKNCDTPP